MSSKTRFRGWDIKTKTMFVQVVYNTSEQRKGITQEAQFSKYRYFCFSKVHFTSLWFYRRPTLAIFVFAIQKKSKKYFCFHRKRWKAKTALSSCCEQAVIEAVCIPGQQEWPHQAPSWEPHSVSASSAIALSCVCQHLYFISIYIVHLLVKCVLRWLLLHFIPFQLTKVFIRMLYFQSRGKTCT